jgi:hypothetical protein
VSCRSAHDEKSDEDRKECRTTKSKRASAIRVDANEPKNPHAESTLDAQVEVDLLLLQYRDLFQPWRCRHRVRTRLLKGRRRVAMSRTRRSSRRGPLQEHVSRSFRCARVGFRRRHWPRQLHLDLLRRGSWDFRFDGWRSTSSLPAAVELEIVEDEG